MWRLWLLFEPRLVVPVLFIFLTGLAVVIHVFFLSVDRFQFWNSPPTGALPAPVSAAPVSAAPVSAAPVSVAPVSVAPAAAAPLASVAPAPAVTAPVAPAPVATAPTGTTPVGAAPAVAAMKTATAPASPKRGVDCVAAVKTATGGAIIDFDVGTAAIPPTAGPILSRLVAALKPCGGAVIEVGGHADVTGPADANQLLSMARAEAVAGYLAGSGIPSSSLIARGYGSSRPLDPARTHEAYQKNRRVEFTIVALKP